MFHLAFLLLLLARIHILVKKIVTHSKVRFCGNLSWQNSNILVIYLSGEEPLDILTEFTACAISYFIVGLTAILTDILFFVKLSKSTLVHTLVTHHLF